MKIAIDGPAGAGKSTIAKIIAEKLKINYLDTGAMYRSVAYALIQSGVDLHNNTVVDAALDSIDIGIRYINAQQRMFYNNEDISDKIRTPEISMGASDVSKNHNVRNKLASMQREVAKKYDVVMDGRDIGTFVLPDADFKFYITADTFERAKRRYLEMPDPKPSVEEIEKDIIARDKNDMERDFAPLKKADDAVVIDTTNMSIEEVTKSVLDIVCRK